MGTLQEPIGLIQGETEALGRAVQRRWKCGPSIKRSFKNSVGPALCQVRGGVWKGTRPGIHIPPATYDLWRLPHVLSGLLIFKIRCATVEGRLTTPSMFSINLYRSMVALQCGVTAPTKCISHTRPVRTPAPPLRQTSMKHRSLPGTGQRIYLPHSCHLYKKPRVKTLSRYSLYRCDDQGSEGGQSAKRTALRKQYNQNSSRESAPRRASD